MGELLNLQNSKYIEIARGMDTFQISLTHLGDHQHPSTKKLILTTQS